MSQPLFSNKSLFHLIWPLVVEQLLLVLVGVISVFMVAYVGEATVSGVALVDSVNYLFIQVLFAFTAGGTVVCAQFIGARDTANASTTGAQLMLTSTLGMLVVAIVFLVGGEQLLGLLFGSVGDDVMADAVVYMRYTVASFPFMALFYSVTSVFRAKGETRISMFAALFMNVLNIVGNAVCIFGLQMGVVGVAMPTLAARVIAAFAMIENGLGMTIMNELITRSWQSDVIMLPLDPPQYITLGMALPSAENAAPAVRKFAEYAVRLLTRAGKGS